MFLEIEMDFESNEALYMQLRNQIIYAIASQAITEGQSLPSVRNMADRIGINMHTVNKAYSVLREDGFVRIDRRKGAVISIDLDRIKALKVTEDALRPIIAGCAAKGITRQETIKLVNKLYDLAEQ